MKIGIPKERKSGENRVALSASGVYELTQRGHQVFVETQAGAGSSITDEEYQAAGAAIVADPQEAWQQELVLKVKEPQKKEYRFLSTDTTLFTYLHLAANRPLTIELLNRKINTIAYESVQLNDGTLPLLAPMSEIAGRLAPQIGARLLEKTENGKGVLLAGVPGVKKAKVLIIGGGTVGCNAAKIALGLGAEVTILDVDNERLKAIDDRFNGKINTLFSNRFNLQSEISQADLVIGAVLLPGHRAPVLVSKEMVASMPKHSVILDIAVDQGGIFATIDQATTHDQPTYIKEEVIHYAVANMPGAVPQTATLALANATLPYIVQLADFGIGSALLNNPSLLAGMTTWDGHLTNRAVAEDLDLPFTEGSGLL